jgi:glyoxylase-like metal-dependent hydrolase (beta-lactamase superfamily II)
MRQKIGPLIHTLYLRMSNAFLIENDQGIILVDTGMPGDERRILEKVDSLGKPLRLIFITHAHFDHYGAARAVRSKTGAPLAIHTGDASAMAQGLTPIRSARGRGRLTLPFLPLLALWKKQLQTTADVLLKDGDQLDNYGLCARVLHTPGHTPGSCCLLLENEMQKTTAAFAGDLVTAGRQPALQQLYADDWEQLNTSLERLRACHPDRVFAGHGSHPITAEGLQGIKP